MKLIVGLGNPGMDYVHTRHNVGFDIINLFAKKNNFNFSSKNKSMLISENNYNGEKIILLKPLTYMNLSGQAVESVAHTYKIEPCDIMVIHDDMDLPLGKIRLRPGGSPAGHNGIKSIINCLNSKDFNRMRVGIGRNDNAIDFVLGKFSKNDRKIIEEAFDTCVDALEDWFSNDINYLMNKYNG